jgi:hypothetical protein
MSCSVILTKEFNAKNLTYSELKVLPNGIAKTVNIKYNDDRLTLQTPEMYVPYDVNENVDDKGMKKYDLNLSFRGYDTNPHLKRFFEVIQQIEDKVITDAVGNSLTWFKKKYTSKDVVAALFSSSIRMDKDKETGEVLNRYPPTMKVRVPYDNKTSRFNFMAINSDDEDIDFGDVRADMKGGKARLLIQFGGIWIAGGKFGCTWRIFQGKFTPLKKARGVVAFRQESDDEDNAEDTNSKADTDDDLVSDAVQAVGAVKVEDSEEEVVEDEDSEVEEEEEELPPPPPPKPVKKVATKAKK